MNRVLKELLKTEREAALNQHENELTPANYAFTPVRNHVRSGTSLYILDLQPRERRKLLYRGKIWVDSRDFAVVRLLARPSRNPSFWIGDTEIHHDYRKTGKFWLPAEDRSVTKVRLGGMAILTIDYGAYRFATEAAKTGRGIAPLP